MRYLESGHHCAAFSTHFQTVLINSIASPIPKEPWLNILPFLINLIFLAEVLHLQNLLTDFHHQAVYFIIIILERKIFKLIK